MKIDKIALYGILFLLLGGGLVSFGLYSQQNAAESLTWPTTTGKVISSEAYKDYSDDSASYRYYVVIEYEYTVLGVHYTSNNYNPNFGSLPTKTYEQAVEIANQYVEGDSVVVYYNPNNPSYCCLFPEESRWSKYFIGFGSFFLVVSVFAFAASIFFQLKKVKTED